MLLKRSLLLCFTFVLIVVVFIILSLPFRRVIASRFILRGDTYLAARAYSQALSEYNQSLKYNRKNILAVERISLTKDIIQDIKAGQNFFQEKNPDLARKINQANQDFSQAKAALQSGQEYLQAQEWQLALIPSLKAVSLDPLYPEAWLALADIYQLLADQCPKGEWPECLDIFSAKAKEAQDQLKSLDPLR